MGHGHRRHPEVSAALSGAYFLRTVLIPIYAAVAWTISLLFGGFPGFRELLFTIVPCAFLAAPIQVLITRIFVRRERRARPRSVVPIRLFYLMVVAAFIDTAVRAVVDHHYSVREDRIAPVGVASFLLGSVATLVVVVALTALLDPRLPPIVSVGTPFLVVGAWRAIDGYRFVHTHDMSDEAIHERDLRMLELNQPTEKVAAPPRAGLFGSASRTVAPASGNPSGNLPGRPMTTAANQAALGSLRRRGR
ncbi:hypothetical protein FAM19024_000497 [Propionibacterium freudenreichii]|uniref:hypothetical protein n=1 Tax=Propionibacterium freudenreichii TaxID=1744 RepID=UPI0024342D99|nr:hypothetical protein [Propionibacterium freudenreichii]WFF31269.1 hypothetical protein FAM19024_000497 [Propionibacterium freudenreichii]